MATVRTRHTADGLPALSAPGRPSLRGEACLAAAYAAATAALFTAAHRSKHGEYCAHCVGYYNSVVVAATVCTQLGAVVAWHWYRHRAFLPLHVVREYTGAQVGTLALLFAVPGVASVLSATFALSTLTWFNALCASLFVLTGALPAFAVTLVLRQLAAARCAPSKALLTLASPGATLAGGAAAAMLSAAGHLALKRFSKWHGRQDLRLVALHATFLYAAAIVMERAGRHRMAGRSADAAAPIPATVAAFVTLSIGAVISVAISVVAHGPAWFDPAELHHHATTTGHLVAAGAVFGLVTFAITFRSAPSAFAAANGLAAIAVMVSAVVLPEPTKPRPHAAVHSVPIALVAGACLIHAVSRYREQPH
jgi:hypothetical protein